MEENKIGIKQLNSQQTVEEIRNYLMSGWALLYGHPFIFYDIENSLYPPGTEANAGFVLIGFPTTIAMCKKTPEFKAMFYEESNTSIICLCASQMEEGTFTFKVGGVRSDADVEKAIEDLAQAAAKYIDTGNVLLFASPE